MLPTTRRAPAPARLIDVDLTGTVALISEKKTTILSGDRPRSCSEQLCFCQTFEMSDLHSALDTARGGLRRAVSFQVTSMGPAHPVTTTK